MSVGMERDSQGLAQKWFREALRWALAELRRLSELETKILCLAVKAERDAKAATRAGGGPA